MKFFLDTANLDELRKGAELGHRRWRDHQPVADRQGRAVRIDEQMRMICDIVDGDISAEVVATEAERDDSRKAASWRRSTRTSW